MKNIKQFSIRAITLLAIIALTVVYIPNSASAAQISSRSVTIGSSAASANTTYSFSFTVPTTTAVKSMDFLACTTASGTCTTPAGFSVATSTLPSQPTGLGSATGWTVSTATAGDLRIANSANATVSSGTQTVSFGSVVNPSAVNSSYFFRMTTYSTATWATAIDSGTVATSTAGQITVTASVDEALTFTLSTATIALGTLTTATTGTGSHTMTASTNAGSGYSITYTGSTLTSGGNTITANASAAASTINSQQFGLNLMANTTPAIGSNVSGGGSGTAQTGYSTANQFKFLSGDTVAGSTGPTNTNVFTASYIANINGVTNPGAYTTVLNYVATANF